MKENKRISALPFISFSESHGFTVHKETIDRMKEITLASECSVLSIVGKAKTGKSYLLNHLLPLLSKNTPSQ